jgi:predicted nucleic acid-binding protein
MRKVIIADTSCLILLDKISELSLLKNLFGEIVITQAVADEFKQSLPEWFKIENPLNKTYQKILEVSLDKGEASAIAFAVEQIDCLLIIDDLKGRRYAEQLGIKITGTLGVIIDAKLTGRLSSVKPLLDKIKKTDFRLTSELEQHILAKAGESRN